MKEPYTIKLNEGQTVIVYHNGRVLVRKKYEECKSIFTAWDSFIGSEEDVNAHIQLLGLSSVKRSEAFIPTVSNKIEQPAEQPAEPEQPEEQPKSGNIITNTVSSVWGSIKSIFSK
jgi:hypothetical protein